MRETTFENARVGDRVYWLTLGMWGEIVNIVPAYSEEPRLEVRFADEGSISFYWFTRSGSSGRISGESQTLFWDEVKIIPPPRPKRMVKKEIDVRVVRDESGIFAIPVQTTILAYTGKVPTYIGEGKLTYEVEE